MNNLKKLLVMSAWVAAIGLLGGLSVFADCEDEDTYVCEDQDDLNFDLDENQDLEEENQDLDDEEDIDRLVEIAIDHLPPNIKRTVVNGNVVVDTAVGLFNYLAVEAGDGLPEGALYEPPAMANPEAQHLTGND